MMLRQPNMILASALMFLPFVVLAADKPTVSLLLSKASAERGKRDVLFRCDAVLDNSGPSDINVKTNFASVFDGLELVVTSDEGKIIAQQHYNRHQSPFSPSGRVFVLPRGRTEKSIVFPIGEIPNDVAVVKVRLVGNLPGSDYQRILSSETLKITFN